MSHKSTFHYGTATTCLLEVVEKDALIQEKEKLYVQLKNIIARLSIAACSLYIYIYMCICRYMNPILLESPLLARLRRLTNTSFSVWAFPEFRQLQVSSDSPSSPFDLIQATWS